MSQTPQTFLDGRVTLHAGDCLEVLQTLPDASVDSVVCDPPYHLTSGKAGTSGFMGKAWDGGDIAFRVELWADVLRVLKPGGFIVAFGGTRTFHRMVCAIEDAGFEIRDTVMWVYGSGFPKSLNVSAGIDKAAGAEREVVGFDGSKLRPNKENFAKRSDRQPTAGAVEGWKDNGATITAPATDAAREWDGWGTALKPAVEVIALAQKPLELSGLAAKLAQELMEQACRLPSFAKDAGSNSALSRSVFVEGFGSARWNAVCECNTPGDLFDLMDTWPSGLEIPSSLNIALSWLSILDAISKDASTFTTETKSSLTTDLKILNSLASTITPSTITAAAIRPNGIGSNASPVAAIFSAVAARLNCIRAISAAGLATSTDALADLRPNCQPICLARKPLVGTVVQNVLTHGTGALNIDGCRVAPVGPSDYNHTGNDLDHTHRGAKDWRMPDQQAKPNDLGRWPANLLLSYPSDEYELRPHVSAEQKRELYRWLSENA